MNIQPLPRKATLFTLTRPNGQLTRSNPTPCIVHAFGVESNEDGSVMTVLIETLDGFMKTVIPEAIQLEPTSDESSWIPWTGGECPVSFGEKVEIKFRNLHLPAHNTSRAGLLRWEHLNNSADIVAYRTISSTLSPFGIQALHDLPETIE